MSDFFVIHTSTLKIFSPSGNDIFHISHEMLPPKWKLFHL